MQPTIGRIVHYMLNDADVEQINRRRTSSTSIRERIQHDKWPLGAQAHIGEDVQSGQVFPMIITAIEKNIDNGVHGQVFLQGNDTYWAKMVEEGTAPGTWSWPPRV